MDRIKNYYDNRIVGKYDSFVVLTEEDRKCWKHARNILVIPNACTLAVDRQALLERKQVIAIGRLTEQKGFDILIGIWKQVDVFHPDWRLVIVGEGEEKARLEEKIRKEGLSEKVEIHPFTRFMTAAYLESSVYALTSRYEGFPMVLVEAMACGVPAVAFDCPSGPAEIISDQKNGFLIPVGDYDLFVKRIGLLMEDEELRKRMGKEAALIITRFSEDQIMKRWDDLFKNLNNQHENLLL